MSISRKLISNTSYLFLDWVITAVLSFVFWLIIWKTLGPIDWGIIGTSANAIILFSSFLVMGLPVTISKLIPHFVGERKLKKAYSLVKFSLKILSIVILVFSVLSVIFYNSISSFLKLPSDAFLLTTASVVFLSFASMLGYAQYGFQNMKGYFLTDVINFIIKTVGTVFLILVGIRYIGPLASIAAGYLATFIARFKRKYISGKSKVDYKEIIKYASPAFISGASWSVIIYSQYILLTVLGGSLAATGIFTVPFTLANLLGVFATVLTTAAFPIVSGLSVGKNAGAKQGRIVSFIFRYVMFFTIPLGILLLVFPQYAILLISKQESLSGSVYLPILVPATILYGLGYILHTNLYAIGKPHLQRNLVLITTGIFLALSALLIRPFSGMGLAFSYLLSMLFLFISSLVYMRKCLKFRTMDAIKILVTSTAITASLFLLQPLIHSIIVLVALLIPMTLAYLAILFFLKFYRREDILVLESFSERFPSLKPYTSFIVKMLERAVKK